MMKKRTLIVLTCVAFVLCGCTPRLVGEAKAKEAGLALINQAFDAHETEAEVKYHEWVGITYEDGQAIQYGTEEMVRVYEIRVDPDESGNARYYAEVDAETGLAYRADKGLSSVILTEEQEQKAKSIEFPEDLSKYTFSEEQAEAMWYSVDWLTQHFEPDHPLLCSVPGMESSDDSISPQQWIESYAVFRHGHIYLVQLLWPTMEVTQIYLHHQEP